MYSVIIHENFKKTNIAAKLGPYTSMDDAVEARRKFINKNCQESSFLKTPTKKQANEKLNSKIKA